jgi:hypothetical protein
MTGDAVTDSSTRVPVCGPRVGERTGAGWARV